MMINMEKVPLTKSLYAQDSMLDSSMWRLLDVLVLYSYIINQVIS